MGKDPTSSWTTTACPTADAVRSGNAEPVSLGLLLDASGSMNDQKLQAAKSALESLVVNHLPPGDELFFVEFGYARP